LIFGKCVLWGAALILSSSAFASTYVGGFEDWAGSQSDYDYNDFGFTISGVTLNSNSGVWFNRASAGTLNANLGAAGMSGTPFWNNASLDAAGGDNIGWCVYGGGACNGGAGIAAADQYLATNSGTSVNDVTFSASGAVTVSVPVSITAGADSLGWELASGGPITYFANGVSGPVTFTPGGDFILVAQNASLGADYSSNAAAGDGVSHFAFFGAVVPEPSDIGMLGAALLFVGLAFRKRIQA
jgi:hypothetical protein